MSEFLDRFTEASDDTSLPSHSPDTGTNWTTVVTVSGNTASTTTHNITPTTARFVRLNVTVPTQTTDTAARIYELEVYGS